MRSRATEKISAAPLLLAKRIRCLRTLRYRHLCDLRFTPAEVALVASGLFILAWSAAVEAGQIARLQSLSAPTN